MKKKVIFTIVGILLIVGILFAARSIRDSHYPIPIKPSAEWEPYVSALDAQRESFFVERDGIKLEADLFIPTGGADQKPAVVFAGGSGDGLYQNYAPGFVEDFILDEFLENGFAVLLVNKRGMGESEGNYVKSSIQDRADDIYAAVQSIQSHPEIDGAKVGLIGHSQGGWVVIQAAADHAEIAFFISLAGPTTTMRENAADNAYHTGACMGLEDQELEEYLEKRSGDIDLSIKIGNLTNFGMFGFDARNMGFDPRSALLTVNAPGLLVYAENDRLVTPSLNLERLDEIFNGEIPSYLKTVTIDGANHSFRLVETPCDYSDDPTYFEQSVELKEVLNEWILDLGY